MTFNEYYNFPEGTNASFLFPISFYDTVKPNFPCPQSMENGLLNYQGYSIPELDVSSVTNMRSIMQQLKNITYLDLSSWDTSKVTNMMNAFNYSSKLVEIEGLENWDVSNVTVMDGMFQSCSGITSLDAIENWDTSNVTGMISMFDSCKSLTRLPAIKCDSLNMPTYSGFLGYTELTGITSFGGFINLKCSLTHDYNLKKLPNLNYQSCINVLNGLYNFTEAGQTPTSSQGKLKVHSNFLTLVGDEISIATAKGWTITT